MAVRAAHRFATHVERLDESEILDELAEVARRAGLELLGAWQVPPRARFGDRSAYAVHRHSSMPAAFWPEYWELYAKHGRSFLATMAWQNPGPFTMSEALREVKPTGSERWIQDLLHRHGARDVFYIPNGSWMVVYWSAKPLIRFDVASRASLQLAANAAAARLQRVSRRRRAVMPAPALSSRQRAVLRLLAEGYSLHEAAAHLGIGYATAQEHAERARAKLGAKNIHHAVIQALRHYVVIGLAALLVSAAFVTRKADCWLELLHDIAENLSGLV